ncbi:MAG: hypothetical protein JWN94_2064 [Betaproteobacteria bacterium]|nr:hypothetical protein [Betaproteobacteria bacterium]
MKPLMRIILLIAVASTMALSSPGFARGGHRGGGFHQAHGHVHGRVGVFIGGPAWYPYYYYPPYPYQPYYYPPVVAAPPTYIEQGSQQSLAPGYWYYCSGSNGYYPYVRECPGGWQSVAPSPAQ